MLVKPHKDLDYLFHLGVDHVYFGWGFYGRGGSRHDDLVNGKRA